MARLTSEFWVAGLLRRVSEAGAFGYVRRRGSSESGSVFIVVDDLQGNLALYVPSLSMDGERLFECRLSDASEAVSYTHLTLPTTSRV